MPADAIKVLLIQEDTTCIERLSELLNKRKDGSFLQKTCTNLSDGIEIAGSDRFDVILLDIDQHSGQELQVLARFREIDEYLPVVVFANEDNEQLAKAAIKAGAQDYVLKNQLSLALVTRVIDTSIELKKSYKMLVRTKEQVDEANLALEREIARVSRLIKASEDAGIAEQRFLAELSYDIRTPLSGIVPMIGLLLETDLDFEQRKLVQTIANSADALLLIMNDRLGAKRIDVAKSALDVVDFDLSGILEETNQVLALKAFDKGIEYVCVTESDVPHYLRSDPIQLRQVLTSLVGNAINFTQNGEVVLFVRLEKETEQNATIHFAVNDTGAGLSAADLDRLLNTEIKPPPPHLSSSDNRELSIAVAKQLVSIMGGELEGASEPGKGSTFFFTLEFDKQHLPQAETEKKYDALKAEHILIVDHSETVRRVCAMFFNSWECRHAVARDAGSALEALQMAAQKNDPFSIILIDIDLIESVGEALSQVIRSDPRFIKTVLVMMASLMQRGDAIGVDTLGFSDYVTKPLHQRQLYDTLTAVIKRAAADEQKAKAPSNIAPPTVDLAKRDLRILLVEDNVANQKVALFILSKLGFRAELVKNGLSAIRALITTDYHLVFMDVQMPGMDGIEATQIIRDPASDVRNHKVPIIATTAHAMAGDRERFLDAGMNDYISKPFEPKQLVDIVQKWTDLQLD